MGRAFLWGDSNSAGVFMGLSSRGLETVEPRRTERRWPCRGWLPQFYLYVPPGMVGLEDSLQVEVHDMFIPQNSMLRLASVAFSWLLPQPQGHSPVHTPSTATGLPPVPHESHSGRAAPRMGCPTCWLPWTTLEEEEELSRATLILMVANEVKKKCPCIIFVLF